MTLSESFEKTAQLVDEDSISRTAAAENNIRRGLARRIMFELNQRAMSVSKLSQLSNCPVSEIRCLIHKELGGKLTLSTIVRVADVLGLDVYCSLL